MFWWQMANVPSLRWFFSVSGNWSWLCRSGRWFMRLCACATSLTHPFIYLWVEWSGQPLSRWNAQILERVRIPLHGVIPWPCFQGTGMKQSKFMQLSQILLYLSHLRCWQSWWLRNVYLWLIVVCICILLLMYCTARWPCRVCLLHPCGCTARVSSQCLTPFRR